MSFKLRYSYFPLIRERQPISRADLARCMNVTRGVVGVLAPELIARGVIISEGATGEPLRGRKPTFLRIRTSDRLAIAQTAIGWWCEK